MWETQVNYLNRKIGDWYKKLPWEPFTSAVAGTIGQGLKNIDVKRATNIAQGFNPFSPQNWQMFNYGINWLQSQTIPLTKKIHSTIESLPGEPPALTKWKEQNMPQGLKPSQRPRQPSVWEQSIKEATAKKQAQGRDITEEELEIEALNDLFWGTALTYGIPIMEGLLGKAKDITKATAIKNAFKTTNWYKNVRPKYAQSKGLTDRMYDVFKTYAEGNSKQAMEKLRYVSQARPELRTTLPSRALQLSSELGEVSKEVATKQAAALPIGKTPIPVVRTEIPQGVTYTTPEDYKGYMANSKQKIQAHQIAKRKGLLNPEGNKSTPQYKKIAETYTGKKSMMGMTEEEADLFITVLERLPEGTQKGGRIIPPSIPQSTKVTPKGFFEKKYGEPTLVRLLTPQIYYSQTLGVKPLVDALEQGKLKLDYTYKSLERMVSQKINEVNKVWGTSQAEKVSSKVKNLPTKATKELRDALDKYEMPPDTFNQEQAELFLWFRNLNRTVLNWENQIRAKLGIEAIPYRQAYVRHVADSMAEDIAYGRREIPEGLKYWSQRLVSKKIFNPMEMKRLSKDLEDYFTKNLEYATHSMLWTGLKSVYLDQPLALFKEQMKFITKDLPLYKGLSGEETEALKKINILPASTRSWVEKYVNQAIKGQQTGVDEEINRMFVNSGMAGAFNKVLSKFGRSLGYKPFTKLAQDTGRLVISAVIGPRPKMMIRNLFQGLQNLALYGVNATVKGYATIPETAQKLLDQSVFLRAYTGFEELPTGAMQKAEAAWLKAYGQTAVFNAKRAMVVAYHGTMPYFENPKYKDLGWASERRTYKEPKGFLYPEEEAKMLREMEFGAGATQYQYTSIGMPELFRSKTLIPFTRLQSWWMNYFTRFHREALTRSFTGKTGTGEKVSGSARLNYMKYLILGGGTLTALGYKRSFMLGVLPHYMSPPVQMGLGLYNYAVAESDYQKNQALRTIYYSYKAFIPGSLAWQDFADAWNGKKPLTELFFYGAEEEPIPHLPDWGIPGFENRIKETPSGITPNEIKEKVTGKTETPSESNPFKGNILR